MVVTLIDVTASCPIYTGRDIGQQAKDGFEKLTSFFVVTISTTSVYTTQRRAKFRITRNKNYCKLLETEQPASVRILTYKNVLTHFEADWLHLAISATVSILNYSAHHKTP